jgi:hypothetical protein
MGIVAITIMNEEYEKEMMTCCTVSNDVSMDARVESLFGL